MKISQSQINLFRSCPYAYALRYYFRREGIWWDPSVVEVGKRVHDAIDSFYKHHYTIYRNSGDILKEVYRILRHDWDTTLSAEYLKKAYTCLTNFAEFEMNNINRGIQTKPLTEVHIHANGLYGIIDYVNLVNRKIIDWKTNTNAGISYENRMQAVMYRTLIREKFNFEIPYFTFQYLFPNEVRIVKFDKKTEEVEKEMYEFIDKIKRAWKEKDFPQEPRTPRTCNGCQFHYYCGGV